MKRWALAVLLVVLSASIEAAPAQLAGYYPQGGPDNGPEDVSLLRLIAQPQVYDQKKIRFIGYLHLEFEGNAVYLHRDDFEIGIDRNAVWINLPKDITPEQIAAVNDHYVICTARFVAGRHGHMGLFSGELDTVTRLQVWPIVDRSSKLPEPPAPPKQQ